MLYEISCIQKVWFTSHLKIVEKEKPTPKAKEVLIKVKAVAINSADHRFLMSDPFFLRFSSGLFHPKIETLGSDISGQVVEVGPGVEKIKSRRPCYWGSC